MSYKEKVGKKCSRHWVDLMIFYRNKKRKDRATGHACPGAPTPETQEKEMYQ